MIERKDPRKGNGKKIRIKLPCSCFFRKGPRGIIDIFVFKGVKEEILAKGTKSPFTPEMQNFFFGKSFKSTLKL
jgi:hypothetical protein